MTSWSALLVAASAAAASPAAGQPQSEAVRLGEGAAALHGTLLTPETGAPASEPVLILPGSGPTDRNGNSPMGVRAAPYRLLAEALAAKGIATLRMDKRGIAESAGAGGAEADLRIGTFAEDARAWAGHLRKRTGASCVWLLGHSEGGLHALIAAQRAEGICGLILVAAPGRPIGTVLREQLHAALGGTPLLEAALTLTAEMEAGRKVPQASVPPPLMALFRPSVQPFLISMLQADPAALLRRFDGPVLVVHGTYDIQVARADADALAGARAGVELVSFEGMNHVLKAAPADRAGNAATYADPDLPLFPGLADRIAAFVREN